MLSIYLSSPISAYQRNWNTSIANQLRTQNLFVYMPQEITIPRKFHRSFEIQIYNRCIEMIQSSDLGLLLYPYGRDCAWEAGYYAGLQKPFIGFLDKSTKHKISRLRDWMVKGGIDTLITSDRKVYEIIKEDPILKHKHLDLITKTQDLAEILKRISNKKLISKHYIGVGAVAIRSKQVLLVKEKEDAQHYLRKKGMWGFPTTLLEKNSPEEQSSISLKREAGINGTSPKFIGTETITNATGIFYRVNIDKKEETKKGTWFDINDVLSEKMYLRPTYRNVLQKCTL